MAIKIRKYDGGEVFDLPADYVIEVSRNNPLFENKGSQTVPVQFPLSVKNKRLLNFSHHLEKSYRPNETIDVILESGSIQQRGKLQINSAKKDSCAANIGFDESEMYGKFKEMQLKDLPDLPTGINFGGANTDSRIAYLIEHFYQVMCEDIEDDYHIFPIVLEKTMIETENTEKTYFEVLNEVQTYEPGTEPAGVMSGFVSFYAERTVDRYVDGQVITFSVPRGYGLSPFLYVWKIIEFIFESFGFTVSENPFKTHRQLKRLVALNNTFDAILTGYLNYRDLMPDITISEFLESLFNKFGMIYSINSNSRTCTIKFIKDLVNPDSTQSIDLAKFQAGHPEISFIDPLQLRLKANRKIAGTETMKETYEEFIQELNGVISETVPGQITSLSSQMFFTGRNSYGIWNIFDWDSEIRKTIYYSDFFDWDKKTPGVGYKDVEMKDLCVGLDFYKDFLLMYYLIGLKHNYSDMVISGDIKETSAGSNELAFAFALKKTDRTGLSAYNYLFASQFNRDYQGNFIYDGGQKFDISLTINREDGLYNRFWKEYDAFIRHANQDVKIPFHFSEIQKAGFDISKIYLVENQPLVPVSLKYKLNTLDEISEIEFKSLKYLKPYDLLVEQEIPTYEPEVYKWNWTSNLQQVLDMLPGLTPWSVKDGSRVYDKFYTVSGNQIPITNKTNYAPTQDQYDSNETRVIRCNAIAVTDGVPDGIAINFQITYTPALIS